MAEDVPKQEAKSLPLDYSYETLATTAFVALANLIPTQGMRTVATIVAAPLGVGIGRLIGWWVKQYERSDVRRLINEEIDDVRTELARSDLSKERVEKLNDELERLRGMRLENML